MAETITIPYQTLVSSPATLGPLLKKAFSNGESALGLVIISDLPPDFAAKRHRLLNLANAFASLPAATRDLYTSPSTSYSFGWSLGRESFNGQPDFLKGSYYNNPLPGVQDEENVWPDETKDGMESVNGFKEAWGEVGGFISSVGVLLAKACDEFVKSEGGISAGNKSIEELISSSHNSKARLLHYFPESTTLPISSSSSDSTPAATEITPPSDTWCGTHIDNSILTGLCPAMYLFHPTPPEGYTGAPLAPIEIPSPSPEAGLWIKTRKGVTVKGVIPANCLAFQTGEALSLLTSDRLAATPHYVSSSCTTLAPSALAAINSHITSTPTDSPWRNIKEGKVSRETLAVFLQPNKDEVVGVDGETFGEFFARILRRYYKDEESR